MKTINKIAAEVNVLSQLETGDPDIIAIVDSIASQVATLEQEFTSTEDLSNISEQIKKLHAAAVMPAKNYQRIASILSGLSHVVEVAKRPGNESIRPKVASIAAKVAGIFAEVDTVQDLDRPLSEIEKAVHSLYSNGQQNNSQTYNFVERGKGHHSK